MKASKIPQNRSKAKYIALKLGERGCSLWDGKAIKNFPFYKSNIVDTTAAGDSFTATLTPHYIQSGDIHSACDIGNKIGSIAVNQMGSQRSMPTIEEIFII